ncbi:hypothetical protein Bra3105_06410 [Brachybacterium halotolerans subsp. kimchii]|uniref:hypothetical protein n=1 Tax=Brachybacterium halotolerans TaxID=2795215 RepID=UPI001E2F8256|nr:hypothetical protein [Brachybacterium halotolerans]UEJ83939.1 hypothetical protein Bra3105_06410 [Brachybacterium halotolerans subsp. kimchii]
MTTASPALATAGTSAGSSGPGTFRPLLDLRQVLDTLAMRILLIVSAVAVLGMALLSTALQPLLLEDSPVIAYGSIVAVGLVLGIVLPVLTVLTVVGEWPGAIQQTFLLRPRRTGVLLSKIVAALLIALVVTAVGLGAALGLSSLVGAISGDGSTFENVGSMLRSTGLELLLGTLFAAGCAALLQGTALAMVISVVLPFVVTVATSMVAVLGSETVADVMRFVDLTNSADTLARGDVTVSAIGAIVLLILIPLVAGGVRWARREIG